MADSPVPLATVAQMQEGAFSDLVRGYTPQAMTDLMLEATRACESECDRRLAPFTALVETHRADGIDPDEYTDAANLPMDVRSEIGASYARALGASSLVRHLWLNEYAPRYQDLWAYSNIQITIIRSYGGSEQLSTAQFIGAETDTGHIWYQLGLFIPVGSMARVTYSGGYQTVPQDLVRACKYMAASIAVAELDPSQTAERSADELENKAVGMLAAYGRQ